MSAEPQDLENKIKNSHKKHLIFSLKEKRYAIPLSKIKEVIGMIDITPIPLVPSFYIGFINLRGQIISVIDLRIKLGLPKIETVSKKTSIIISHVGDILVGSIVDEVIEVVSYQSSDIDLMDNEQAEKSSDGIYGVAKDKNENLTLLINLQKSFNKTEFKVLNNQDNNE